MWLTWASLRLSWASRTSRLMPTPAGNGYSGYDSFHGPGRRRSAFLRPLGGTADVEVGLLDFQLDGFAGLLFRFTGDEEVLFGLVDFSLGRAAVIEIIGDASSYFPAALIGIDAGKVLSAQSLPPVIATVGLLPASAMSILRSASWTAMAAWRTSGRYFMA
mgnify:CR=1 FL=1